MKNLRSFWGFCTGVFVLGILASSLSLAAVEERHARLFEIGKTTGEPLFRQDITLTTSDSGDLESSSSIKDNEGTLLMTEKARIHEGHILHQLVQQLQIKETYELKVENKKATFRTWKRIGDDLGQPDSQNVQDVDSDFSTGPATEAFLAERWPLLEKDESVHVEFGIFEFAKSVGFKFKKTEETADLIRIRMKATNFFISLMMDPIQLGFRKSDKHLVYYKGPTPLKRMINGKWKAFEAEILYP